MLQCSKEISLASHQTERVPPVAAVVIVALIFTPNYYSIQIKCSPCYGKEAFRVSPLVIPVQRHFYLLPSSEIIIFYAVKSLDSTRQGTKGEKEGKGLN